MLRCHQSAITHHAQVSSSMSPRLRQLINAGIFTPRVGRLGMPTPVVPRSLTIVPTAWEQEVRWVATA